MITNRAVFAALAMGNRALKRTNEQNLAYLKDLGMSLPTKHGSHPKTSSTVYEMEEPQIPLPDVPTHETGTRKKKVAKVLA